MSFNLNKNDGRMEPVKKSNFDLSKSAAAEETGTNAPLRGQKWWLIGLAVLVTGVGVWYFTANNSSPDISPEDSTMVAQQVKKDSVATDTMRPVINADPIGKTDSAGITPVAGPAVVAASYKAGAVQPLRIAPGVIAGIREKLAVDSSVKISVLGYASSEGSLQVNQRISQERADAFRRVLIRKGVAADKVTAEGRGIQDPVSPNDTEEGRRKNRRVEVVTGN